MAPLAESLLYMMTPIAILWLLIGVTIGVIAGAIPGLGGGIMMALVLPMTFVMGNIDAQILLIAIYTGGVSGGLISAVLLGVPGTPAQVMTVLDGFQMTRRGRATQALSIGITASFVGGVFSWILLASLSAPLADVASKFQSFDYFSFIFLGLTLIAFAGSESLSRGLISGFFGIFVAMVGFDTVSATNRFTFGIPTLTNGFDILPVIIGAFAVRQILTDVGNPSSNFKKIPETSVIDVIKNLLLAFKYPLNLFRSSLIGSWIGLLPGIGANIGAVISYSVAKSSSKEKHLFGKGSEQGIVASESGNNATVGGALMPMISLGIPGSGQDVLLMAALTLHYVEPGPLLIYEHPDVFYGIISAYLFANIFMLLIMVSLVRYLAKIVNVPRYILSPLVLLFCVVGVVSANNRLTDVWVMLFFGIIGFAMTRFKYPLAPFIIGYVLAPLAEDRLRSALMGSGGDWIPLITRPVAIVCFAISVVLICLPLIKSSSSFRKKHSS